MDLGVYFPQRTEYADLASLGIKYAVRPVVKPATDTSTDAGFVSDSVIERTDDPTYHEAYGADEVDDPTYGRLRLFNAKAGSFVDIGNGGWGFDVDLVPPTFGRGVLNYVGIWPLMGGMDVTSLPRGFFTYLNCLHHWGTDWTAVIWARHPRWWVRFQINRYRKAGVKRLFLWRWDYDKAWIKDALQG